MRPVPSWRRAWRHPLDARWTQAVGHGALLDYELTGYQPPQEQQLRLRLQDTPNRAVVPGSHSCPLCGRRAGPRSISRNSRQPIEPIKSIFTFYLGVPMRRVYPSSQCSHGLYVFAQAIVHLSHLKSLPRLPPFLSLGISLPFSQPSFNAVVPYCASGFRLILHTTKDP